MFSANEHLPGSTPEIDLGAAHSGGTVDAAHFRAACGIALCGKGGSDRDVFHVEIERTTLPSERERERGIVAAEEKPQKGLKCAV